MKKSLKRTILVLLVFTLLIGIICVAFVGKKLATKVLWFLESYSALSNSVESLSSSVDLCLDTFSWYKTTTGDLDILVNQMRDWTEYTFDYTWLDTTPPPPFNCSCYGRYRWQNLYKLQRSFPA